MPNYLCEILPDTVGSNVNIKTRTSDNLRQYPCKGASFAKSLMPYCIDMWNELEDDVKSIVDFEVFKNVVIEAKSKEELYNFGDRKWNIIHAQLRLNCSNLNSHLVSLHVLDDATCLCGFETENTNHFFFSCPLYTVERQELMDNVNTICDATLNTLLFGNNDVSLENNQLIFSYVHDFIKKSKRF